MKRNCIYRYLSKNSTRKDIVIYEYNNSQKYILKLNSMWGHFTYDLTNNKKVKDNETLDLIWFGLNVLAVYDEGDILFFQVEFPKNLQEKM